MPQIIICDQCGQQITSQNATLLSITVQSPSPETSPNICSYVCAINWLANRQQNDLNAYGSVTTPATTAYTPPSLTSQSTSVTVATTAMAGAKGAALT